MLVVGRNGLRVWCLESCPLCLIDVFGRIPNKKAIKYENQQQEQQM